MRKKLSIAVVSVAAALAVWSVHHVRQSRARIADLTATVHDLKRDADTRSRMARASGIARARVRGVTEEARAIARHEALRALEEQSEPGGPSDPGEHEQRPAAITFEESRDRVVSDYEHEPIDADWSAVAERDLEEIARKNVPDGSRVHALACKTTICRLEISHTDPEAHASFLLDGMHDWPGALLVADETQQDGEYVVTVYAAREGSELPLGPR